MENVSDAHLLVAALHRMALVRLSSASHSKQQGLTMAAKQLRFSSRWRRRTRELDACLGLVEKISWQSINDWMKELEEENAHNKEALAKANEAIATAADNAKKEAQEKAIVQDTATAAVEAKQVMQEQMRKLEKENAKHEEDLA